MELKKKELKQILKNKKGYYNNGKLRKGINWLANHYNVKPDLISEIYNELKNENNDVPTEIIKSIKHNNELFSKIPAPSRITNVDLTNINRPGTYWITGCTHAPFHNKAMYNSTFNYLVNETELSGIILNGDILDMHSISRHNKGLITIPNLTLDKEYKQSNKFFDELDEMLAMATKSGVTPSKHYLFGNHEKWYYTALKDVNIHKYGEALKSPVEALKLDDRGYLYQTDYNKAHINFGNHLEINHGEFTNVHAAKKTIDTYRKSIIFNHTHRFQIYMEGLVGGYNIGWGGDINAPVFNYATRAMKNSWVNASALLTLDNTGGFHVQPLLFINNKLIVNGKEY